MAAGLGFTEFATGDVLTAAAANGYLASQVVMVFASAAARTSAIASPQEGMISYLKDTDATQYYSGSAWTSIGGAGSTGDWVKIETISPSGAATATFSDNVFSSTYKFYQLRISCTQSGSSTFTLQGRSGGSTKTTTVYNRGLFVQKMDSGNGTVALGANNQTSWLIGYADGGNAFQATVDFYGAPQTSSGLRIGGTLCYQGVDAAFATLATGFGGLSINSSNAFDSLILSASSNMTGTVTLYGMKA